MDRKRAPTKTTSRLRAGPRDGRGATPPADAAGPGFTPPELLDFVKALARDCARADAAEVREDRTGGDRAETQ